MTAVEVRFGDLLAEPLRNGVYKPKEYHGRGAKVINMKELFAYERIDDQATDRVYLEPNELARVHLRSGDLLFARRSFVLEGAGKCSIIGNPSEDTTFESSMIRARPDTNKVLPQFIYYLFASPLGRAAMASIATRTAVSGITGKSLQELMLPLPPLLIQGKIAAIMSAYDSLIENNHRRITILAEMAQRIYREWFVDFRYPGFEQVPMVDSELGPIPEGWTVAALSSLTEVITRGVSPKYADASEELVINQKCIRGGALNLDFARAHVTTVPSAKTVRVGDVLINSTGVGTLGRVAQVLFSPETRLAVDSHVTIVRPAPNLADPDFLGLTLLEREPELASMGVGSTGQTELGRAVIGSIKVVVPPLQWQNKFSDTVSAIRSLPISLAKATRTLRATRDLLLPRLISGEIDVTDLDIAMPEEAT